MRNHYFCLRKGVVKERIDAGGGSWHIIYISHHCEVEVTSYIDQLNKCSGGRSGKVECLEEGSGW